MSSFNAKEVPIKGGNFVEQLPLDPGGYPARVVVVANLGLHVQEYQGTVKEPKNLIGMTYECLDEFMKDEDGEDVEDKPRWFSETFPFNNLSNDRAKSTLRYKAIDPSENYGGDFSKLLDTPVVINLIKKKSKKDAEKVYNNIDSISTMRVKEANSAPELINTPQLFDFYSPTEESWKALNPWFQREPKGAID